MAEDDDRERELPKVKQAGIVLAEEPAFIGEMWGGKVRTRGYLGPVGPDVWATTKYHFQFPAFRYR